MAGSVFGRGRSSSLVKLAPEGADRGWRAMSLPVMLSRIYLFLALLAATFLSPLPYSAIALALFLVQVYLVFRPFRAEFDLLVAFLSLLLLPWTLDGLMRQPIPALLMIPAMLSLGHSLKENASSQLSQQRVSRGSRTLVSLFTALLSVLVVSVLVISPALTVAAALLIGYLGVLLIYVLWRTRGALLVAGLPPQCRVVAGNEADITVAVGSRAGVLLHVLLESPYPWARVEPSQFKLKSGETKLRLTVAPGLSGPAKLAFRAVVVDAWGLTQRSQLLELLELHVIPRARYAEWLAKKYLELAGSQVAPVGVTASVAKQPWGAYGGVEFYGTRLYQPGDSLKNVDWRHTFKLHRLVVKEYLDVQGQAVVMVVNLAVEDPEAADEVASNLISLALVLAREGVPTALAAYDDTGVSIVAPAKDPKEALREAIRLAQQIVHVKMMHKYLEPSSPKRLRRTIAQLGGVKTEPARRLMGVLQLEREAVELAVKNHPATLALVKVASSTPSPALLAVISCWNHDAEALLVALDKLERRGYRAMAVGTRPRGREDIAGLEPALARSATATGGLRSRTGRF